MYKDVQTFSWKPKIAAVSALIVTGQQIRTKVKATIHSEVLVHLNFKTVVFLSPSYVSEGNYTNTERCHGF